MNIPIESILAFMNNLVKERSTKLLMVLTGVFSLGWGLKEGWVQSDLGTYGIIILVALGVVARLIQDMKCLNGGKKLPKIEETDKPQ
jgi:hypothetical protein